MQTIRFIATGIRPMLMHSSALVDWRNPCVKRKKEITKKSSKKMTDADYEELERLDWEGGLWWDDTDGLIVPSNAIEANIRNGARKSRLGKDVEAVVFCTQPHVKIQYAGPKTKDALYAHGIKNRDTFVSRVAIRVANGSRVMRVRPMIPTGWKLNVELEFDETVMNREDILKAIQDAGAMCGIGDWTPKFGRYIPEFL